MKKLKENISAKDALFLRTKSREIEKKGAPAIKFDNLESNVVITLRKSPHGEIVEKREGHNIFLDYGREWLAELISLNTSFLPFRNDRIAYVAFGIGGTNQLVDSDTIRTTWQGYPNRWGYTDPDDLTTGGYGYDATPGSGDPSQTDTDPEVTGLEYPVQVTSEVYFDRLVAPATFPEAGTVRFTSVLGYNEVSFGSATSVPLSEIGLFTESRVSTQSYPPLSQSKEVSPPLPPNPPLGVRYMVAYNTFDTLSKTSALVLQLDWELRFA